MQNSNLYNKMWDYLQRFKNCLEYMLTLQRTTLQIFLRSNMPKIGIRFDFFLLEIQ